MISTLPRIILAEALRTAFRRFGGLPAIARSEGGSEKVIQICLNEAAAFCPKISVKTMRTSDGGADYFVSIEVGDREITPYKFREEFKAAYEADSLKWLLLGAEKPDLMAYGPGDWPGRGIQPPAWTERELRLHDALMPLTGYILANFKHGNYSQWKQGGVAVIEVARKALEESPPEGAAPAEPADAILDEEPCAACRKHFRPQDLVLYEASGGFIHAACCGPEPESYYGADGEPLKEGDPIPEPFRYDGQPCTCEQAIDSCPVHGQGPEGREDRGA